MELIFPFRTLNLLSLLFIFFPLFLSDKVLLGLMVVPLKLIIIVDFVRHLFVECPQLHAACQLAFRPYSLIHYFLSSFVLAFHCLYLLSYSNFIVQILLETHWNNLIADVDMVGSLIVMDGLSAIFLVMVTLWDTLFFMEMGLHPFLKFVIPSFVFVSLFVEGVLEQRELEISVTKPQALYGHHPRWQDMSFTVYDTFENYSSHDNFSYIMLP